MGIERTVLCSRGEASFSLHREIWSTVHERLMATGPHGRPSAVGRSAAFWARPEPCSPICWCREKTLWKRGGFLDNSGGIT